MAARPEPIVGLFMSDVAGVDQCDQDVDIEQKGQGSSSRSRLTISNVTGLASAFAGKRGMPCRLAVGMERWSERRASSDRISPIGRFSRSAIAFAAASTSSSMVRVVRTASFPNINHQSSSIILVLALCDQYAGSHSPPGPSSLAFLTRRHRIASRHPVETG